MKKSPFMLMLIIATCSCSSQSVAENFKVYHVGFDVDTITGYHEENFPSAGCAGMIDQKGFLSLLQNHELSSAYRKDDIKSMIIPDNGLPYYVDYYGSVRHGQDFYTINKGNFERMIVYNGKC